MDILDHQDLPPEEKMPSQERSYFIFEIVLFTLIFFFLPALFIREAVPTNLPPYILQYLLITVIQFAIYIFILRRKDKSAVKTFGLLNFKWSDSFFVLGLTLALFILLMLFNLLISLLPPAVSDFLTKGMRWQPQKNVPVAYLLIFSLAIGFREEFFFRSYLLTRFTGIGIPPVLAIIVSSVLFSAGHIYEGIVGLLFAFTQAIIFSFFFLYKRSLPTLALAHGLYNFGSLLLATYTNT